MRAGLLMLRPDACALCYYVHSFRGIMRYPHLHAGGESLARTNTFVARLLCGTIADVASLRHQEEGGDAQHSCLSHLRVLSILVVSISVGSHSLICTRLTHACFGVLQ